MAWRGRRDSRGINASWGTQFPANWCLLPCGPGVWALGSAWGLPAKAPTFLGPLPELCYCLRPHRTPRSSGLCFVNRSISRACTVPGTLYGQETLGKPSFSPRHRSMFSPHTHTLILSPHAPSGLSRCVAFMAAHHVGPWVSFWASLNHSVLSVKRGAIMRAAVMVRMKWLRDLGSGRSRHCGKGSGFSDLSHRGPRGLGPAAQA